MAIQVPYSNHSNFKEIDTFVACVKPGSLVNMLTNQSDHLYQAHGTFRLAHVNHAGTAFKSHPLDPCP